VATPFKAVSSGPKDAYNFYHSQVRITIECAFGMLVHRWGILRKAIPLNISLSKTSALVVALCKLHNFCINENDTGIAQPTSDDSLDIAISGGFTLPAFERETRHQDFTYTVEDRVDTLLDAGNHFLDVPRHQLRQLRRHTCNQTSTILPFQDMLQLIEEGNFHRPLTNRRN
jgi:hypothetical protein